MHLNTSIGFEIILNTLRLCVLKGAGKQPANGSHCAEPKSEMTARIADQRNLLSAQTVCRRAHNCHRSHTSRLKSLHKKGTVLRAFSRVDSAPHIPTLSHACSDSIGPLVVRLPVSIVLNRFDNHSPFWANTCIASFCRSRY